MKLIPEENFAEIMKNEVERKLASLCEKGRVGGLYYELFAPKDARAFIVISHGSTENCEKYHELIYYFLQSGFGCAVMDHRGHGFSEREGKNPNVVHISDFDRYIEDFHAFLSEKVKPAAGGLPLYLYAHSMGGCIAALTLERYPREFSRAVLSSPMIGIDTGGIPVFLCKLICNFMRLLGKGEEKLWFQGDFDPATPFEDDAGTSRARFEYYHNIRTNEPAYRLSASSYGWTAAALRATAEAQKNVKNIKTPTLIFAAERDGFVSQKAIEHFAKKLSDGRLVRTSGTKHEIYRSENPVLSDYLDEVTGFFGK